MKRHGENKLFQTSVKVSRICPRLVDLSMVRPLSVNPFVIIVHSQLCKSMSHTHYWRIQPNLLTSILGKNTAIKPELFQKYPHWCLGESKIQNYRHRKILKLILFSSFSSQKSNQCEDRNKKTNKTGLCCHVNS